MLTALDHVIIAVASVDAAEPVLTALLGRAPSWRGAHPEAGTANVLYRLDNTYLELLAPAGTGPHGDALRGHLDGHGEGLLGLAFATDDAAACHAALASRGLSPAAVADGVGRETATRAERRWRNVMLPGDATRGVLLFAIEHLSEPELLPPAASVAGDAAAVHGLDHVVVQTADPDATLRLYGEGLGLRLALDRRFPQWGVRLSFFRVGGVTVEVAARLEGEGAGQAPPPLPDSDPNRDRLWGLSYRVSDVEAARARALAAGFDVSEVRPGRRPQTRVCTVRGEPLGVATLLLGPDLGAT